MGFNLRGMRKSSIDAEIEGVCGGLGEYTHLPVWMWRTVFVVFGFACGASVVVYLAFALCMPDAEGNSAY
ncbi:MAG: PspC domain-containing protein [Rudaea sp.]